jgi:hypothetical protein
MSVDHLLGLDLGAAGIALALAGGILSAAVHLALTWRPGRAAGTKSSTE